MALEEELKAYQDQLESLLQDEGKFAVFVGSDLIGVFSDYADALKAGYVKVGGNKPFLAKRIERFDPPVHLRCVFG